MGIQVTVHAGTNKSNSNVSASGSVQHVITDKERGTFKIKDKNLKAAIKKYFGKKPNDAYLHSKTPWKDLYKRYHWSQVQTMLVVKSAKIVGITSDPSIIATKAFTNNSSRKATFNASISDQVSNTVESNWSQTNTIEVGQSVSYGVSFLGSGAGGETSFSYSNSWGKGGSKSKTISVGSDSGVSVELEPGDSIDAQLSASRGVMKVRITYKAYLTGRAAINYNPRYKGHHFYALNIQSIMRSAKLPSYKTFTEDIEIGFYSNSKVELKDSNGRSKGTLSKAIAGES